MMNYVNSLFERCHMENICHFLLYGVEPNEKNAQSYYERTRKVYDEFNEWLKKQCESFEEYEKQSKYIDSLTSQMENVFLQIGFRAGVMFAMDLYHKK